ncbi:unnamed protein product [Hymenolepis diminuta]|uniref:Peptidase S1 domain-containing protein n=1 Tax=Hymenolepis diminuta TaxID=6216 RepID=A0A3P7A663_HYMDI|nr:unnamed protein product [Hymenolepis diminuta]
MAVLVSRVDSLPEETAEADVPLRRVRRIIGGDYVKQRNFPYMVSIQAKLRKDIFASLVGGVEHFCGGTLISPRWILTASHCLYAYDKNNTRIPLVDPKIWHVRMGTKELRPTFFDRVKGTFSRLFNFFYGQRKLQTFYHLEKIILHPKYEEPNLEYDIALLKVKERIQLRRLKDVDVLRLPFPGVVGENYPPANMTCTAIGWGSACVGCMPEMNMKAVELPIISHDACQKIFVSPINLTQTMEFCAGYVNGSKGIGSGDSGGPLVCDFEGMMVLAGVTSAIHAKYPESYPAVFTRVAAFTEWLLDTMKSN